MKTVPRSSPSRPALSAPHASWPISKLSLTAPAPKQSMIWASPPPQHPSSTLSTSSSLGQLSRCYYVLSCPSMELVVRDVVRLASIIDPTIPSKLSEWSSMTASSRYEVLRSVVLLFQTLDCICWKQSDMAVEVVLRHFHWHCYKSSTMWFLVWSGLKSLDV
jgi:hypothetical protein